MLVTIDNVYKTNHIVESLIRLKLYPVHKLQYILLHQLLTTFNKSTIMSEVA